VGSKNHVLKALRDACFNRTVGVTQFNEYSSRSHFILTLFISVYDKVSRQTKRGKLSLVDLAGSERILHSQAEGIRVKEANFINKSLSTLGNVFLSLQNKSPHVPYRDCKLTHYLKDHLSGNSKTMLILQVSPTEADLRESLSTLVFGKRISLITRGSVKADVSRSRSASNNRGMRKFGRASIG
jgi:kinesin family protein C2/C3